jgi:NB-ARC domain
MNLPASSQTPSQTPFQTPPQNQRSRTAIQHMPDPVDPFIGRDREIQAIKHVVTQGVRVLAIAEAQPRGGVGKSALAITIAHHLQPEFGAIQLYANLYGNDTMPRPTRDVLQEFLTLRFGIDPLRLPQDMAALQLLYQQRLQNQPSLILLDNAASYKQIEPLLPNLKTCVVLITSRKAVLEKDQGKTMFLDALSESAALPLIQAIAGADRVPQEGSVMRQLLQLAAGSPLLVRLLGAFLRHQPNWTSEMLVLRLQQERVRLKLVDEADRNIRACLALCYQALKPDQQILLNRLSVLRGDEFDIAMAAHMNDTEDQAQTRSTMNVLVDRGWVEPGFGGDRFKLHDILRAFIWEQVNRNDRQTLILSALAWHDQQFSAIDQLLAAKLKPPMGNRSLPQAS